MRAGADEINIISIDFVDQQPVWLDVAVAVAFPSPAKGMVLAMRWQRLALQQEQNHLAQFGHVLAAFLCELHVALKLRPADGV